MAREVEAELEVDDGVGGERSLSIADFQNGSDGSSPPLLPGGSTGVRGWLRLLYQVLTGTLLVEGAVALDQGTIDALGTATPGIGPDDLPLPVDIAPITILARIGADITPNTDTVVAPSGGRLKVHVRHAGDDGRIWINVDAAAADGVGIEFLEPGEEWQEFTQAAVHVRLVDATVAQRVIGAEWAI